MTDINNAGNSEPVENTVDNITPSDFIDRRLNAGDNVEETNQAEAPKSTPEETQATESNDVLSQMDLDNMSEDQLKEISQKLGTKAVARFGELTARRKQAEERLQRLERELADVKQQRQEVPEVKDNPLKNVSDPKELRQHNDSAREIIEWAENLLDDHEDARANDVIADIDGKKYTKVDVKKNLRQSREVVNKFVPAQAAELQKKVKYENDTRAFQRKALTEFAWMKDKNSSTTKRYNAMINDKRLAKLSETNPELSAQMPYLLAHAANSMYGRKLVSTNASNKAPSITPPKTTPSNTATPERKPSSVSANQKEIAQQFAKSGNTNDYIALRTLQLSQRK
jgi:hypothetical protein